MTINEVGVVNSGLNGSLLVYFGAVEPRASAQHLPTLRSKTKATLRLMIQAWQTRAPHVPTVTTLADFFGGQRGPSGWFLTVCLAPSPCCGRPRWSSYKDIWTNYISEAYFQWQWSFSRMVNEHTLTSHITQTVTHGQFGISNQNVIRCLFWTSDWIKILSESPLPAGES